MYKGYMIIVWWMVDCVVYGIEMGVDFVDIFDMICEMFEILAVVIFFWVLVMGQFYIGYVIGNFVGIWFEICVCDIFICCQENQGEMFWFVVIM